MMEDNMMKWKEEDNSKENSLANGILVHWKWDDRKIYRTFLRLRSGGTSETQHDLNMKYPEESLEQETLLLYSDQLVTLPREEQKTKIVGLLSDETWRWDPAKEPDFASEIDKFLK